MGAHFSIARIRLAKCLCEVARLSALIFIVGNHAIAENFANRLHLAARMDAFESAPTVSWKDIRFQHVIPQKLDYSCGSAALATLLAGYWRDDRFKREEDMVSRIKTLLTQTEIESAVKDGFSFLHLQRVCQALGYHAEAYVDVPSESFKKIDLPVIVRIKRGKDWHFVVANGLPDGRMLILDPALGNLVMSMSKFISMWDGRILEVQHTTMLQPAINPLTKLKGGIIAVPLNYSSQQIQSSKTTNILKR